jgi:hypothetical protein
VLLGLPVIRKRPTVDVNQRDVPSYSKPPGTPAARRALAVRSSGGTPSLVGGRLTGDANVQMPF